MSGDPGPTTTTSSSDPYFVSDNVHNMNGSTSLGPSNDQYGSAMQNNMVSPYIEAQLSIEILGGHSFTF